MCVCVCVRERERESVCVCVFQRETVLGSHLLSFSHLARPHYVTLAAERL